MSLPAPYRDYVVQKFEASPVFRGVSDAAMREMLGHFRQTTWSRGTLAAPDSLLKWFYLIVDGRARVDALDPRNQRRFTLSLLGPGDGFDLVTLLDGKPHDVETLAVDELHLVHAPMERMREWIRVHPEFNRNFLTYLGQRMREMEGVTTDLATSDTATRLARLILRHTGKEIDADGHHVVRLINDFSHEALARMIGSTRQVVNRHLQALRHDRILRDGQKKLKVADLEALSRRATHLLGDAGRHKTPPGS